ncbi:MAG: hypothetical protein JST01_17485 [Cyanobacteria bacterium SZAS TMP-1]|nr:hypothetical protein [Cyanobacteria bacterium SZAS TMP-1]
MSGRDRNHDAPSGGKDSHADETSGSLLGNIWHKTTEVAGKVKDGVVHGAGVAKDKVEEVARDPNVRAHVQKGVDVTARIGKGVANDMANEGKGVARDAKSGNYAGIAEKALPILVTGGAGLVVKEVAPSVMKHGMNELPAGTRDKIQSSGVGNIVLRQVERGNIPTSPTDLPGMVLRGAKDEVVHGAKQQVVRGAIDQVRQRSNSGDHQQSAGQQPEGGQGRFTERTPVKAGDNTAAARDGLRGNGTAAGQDGSTAGKVVTSTTQKVGSWLHLPLAPVANPTERKH